MLAAGSDRDQDHTGNVPIHCRAWVGVSPEYPYTGHFPESTVPGINSKMANPIKYVQREFVALRRATVTYSDARKPVFHAVTPFCRIALCSAEPGVKSGWAEPPANQVTCHECLRRLTRLWKSA